MPEGKTGEAELSLLFSDSVVSESTLNSAPQPELFGKVHKSITVVCACIMRQGGQQILLSMRRAPGVPGLDGKWELPGGKIEFGEAPEQTIVREISEELGMTVRPIRLLPYLHTNLWEYEHAVQHVVLACYECELKEESMPQSAADDAKWFHVNEIEFGSTLPGTTEFVSLAAKNDWFDKVYIEFECLDSSTNAAKRFAVATQSTLFSKYGLVKYSWAGTGASRRTKSRYFESPKELDEQIFETAKRRLAAGYHIRTLKGPDRYPDVLVRVRELAKQWNEHFPAADRASAI
jgi:8-oxo-dGTP diphosphatase